VTTALDGSWHQVAEIYPLTDFHEFVVDCVGSMFTIGVDGQTVYGPVASSLRPTAVLMGNPCLAFWYPTDWTSFSVDYVRVETPEQVAVAAPTWGAVKAMFRR
jgi:hypothetical protein